MGRPRSRSTSPRGMSRRHFLRGAGALSALIAAPPLSAAFTPDDGASGRPVKVGAGIFVHGVASGDPLADRVILWTRVTISATTGNAPVNFVVALDPTLTQVVATGSATASEKQDYTVKVDVTGLSPNTTYYYQFTSGTQRSPVGRTRTLPVGSIDHLRVAVLSCASLAHGYFNAYRHVAKRADLDLVVHLGDYIYEYGDGEYGSLRAYDPPMEIVTLLEYRTRHNQYKADPDLQELHRQHPMVAVWDDHEFADDAWKGGASNHQPASEGKWGDRVAAAMRAYYEWMPVRPVSTDRRRLYRSFQLGDLAELFMLEERVSGRSEQADPNVIAQTPLFTEEGEFADSGRNILAKAQQDWLVEGLRKSTARWKLIGQGVMMAPARVALTPQGENVFFNPDQWDGYKPARDRLLGAIGGPALRSPVKNAVILTGDIHSSWAADLSPNPYGGDYDPSTGEGSLAVEFVGTSVTSPGQNDPDGQAAAGLRTLNPHLKYVELTRRGYLLLDINDERVSGEWWYVDTIATRTDGETFGKALQTLNESRRLSEGVQSASKSVVSPPAP